MPSAQVRVRIFPIAQGADDLAALRTPELARWVAPISVDVERAIDAGCAAFSMKLAPSLLSIARPQALVQIFCGDRLVLLGRIDAFRLSRRKDGGSTLEVGGRDITADLIDCSPVVDVEEWVDIRVEELAALFADAYGIVVQAPDDPTEPLPLFKLNAGESCWNAIERACRIRGLLAYSLPDGKLQIAAPGQGSASISTRRLDSFLTAELEMNDADRFQFYSVRAQQGGSDTVGGDAAILVEASALDTGMRRARRLTVLCEGAASDEDAQVRAQWEATVRAARAQQLRITRAGWLEERSIPGGTSVDIWKINSLVPVWVFGINENLLVKNAVFHFGSDGTTVELGFVRPDAFVPQPEVEEQDPFAAVFEPEEE